MLKSEKTDVPDQRVKKCRTTLIFNNKTTPDWYNSTVAQTQQHSTKQPRSFSVHIVATAPKLSPARRKRA
jgi:hypothetical protein